MSLLRAPPSLPTELYLQVFQSLDTLSDVISLAAASRAWRNLWLEHANPIYCRVAPKCIEGEKHARQLHMAMSGDNDVNLDSVLNIMRRARFVDNTIIPQFEEQVVSQVKAPSLYQYYNNKSRPQHLTTTERRRFIRTYYQIWAIIILDESSWKANIEACSIKQIYLMYEMSRIPLPIGDYLPDEELLKKWPYSFDAEGQGPRGRLRSALKETTEAYIPDFWETDGFEDPWWVSEYTWKKENYAGFALLWDHGKRILKLIALYKKAYPPVKVPQEDAEYQQQHRWVESSSEEGDI